MRALLTLFDPVFTCEFRKEIFDTPQIHSHSALSEAQRQCVRATITDIDAGLRFPSYSGAPPTQIF